MRKTNRQILKEALLKFGRALSGFQIRDSRFPRVIKGHWYCGCWYLYLGDLRDSGDYSGTTLDPEDVSSPARIDVWPHRLAFNPFHTGHARDDVSALVDGLIPAVRVADKIGLYKQIGRKYRDSAFYDGAMWDDGYKIDLRFIRCIDSEVRDAD